MAWRKNPFCRHIRPSATETRFVKRPVGVEHFVPIVVFAELIAWWPGPIHRHAFAGAEALVELEIDLRDDVVGIEFFAPGRKPRRLCPVRRRVAAARPRNSGCASKNPGHDGVRVLFARHVKFFQPSSPQLSGAFGSGGATRAQSGRTPTFPPRPECLVPGDLIFVRQRRQKRVFGQCFQFVNQAVGLRIKLFEIVAKTGMQVI